jgi:hypothetical protein
MKIFYSMCRMKVRGLEPEMEVGKKRSYPLLFGQPQKYSITYG